MPVNAGIEYGKAEEEYLAANTPEEKLIALQKMLSLCPKHKGSEKLQKEIKEKIKKVRDSIKKAVKKGGFQKVAIKKEGAALIVIAGTTNSGKSTLLNKLTNANAKVAVYPFTTKEPVQGVLDYKGIKLQVVEIPAIVEDFKETELGPSLLNLIRNSDLIILTFNTPEEKEMLDKELADVDIPFLIYNLLIVANIDNVLRIYLITRKTQMSQVIVLIGMIGGLFIFGMLGVLLGPLLLAYFITFLNAYRDNTLSSLFKTEKEQ